MTESRPRILFVDDDATSRHAIASQLRDAGFDIDEAGTAQGLRMITPHHDVAILEVERADLSVWDLCRRIKSCRETADVKVLELSATLATAEDRARGLDEGADCYLVHPVELVELVAALRSLIRLRDAERARQRAQDLLLATLGHDLRNPLNVISTGLAILGESFTLAPTDRDVVRRIDRTVERMRRMIEQLLVYAQTLGGEIIPVSPAPLDLTALVEQIVIETRQATRHPCELRSTLADPVLGDGDKLARLVENLVVNAIRHGEGPVTVELSRADAAALLAVHNRGPAIGDTLRANLFQPFTRTHRSTGLGLGLYIVSQIARAHHGHVHVDSSPETGTTFTVELPLAR